jgi:hypothetical protein
VIQLTSRFLKELYNLLEEQEEEEEEKKKKKKNEK